MLTNNIILALAPLALLARASVEFDFDDVPRACRDLCRPVDRLVDSCEVDLDDGDDDDDREDLLEWQCVCTNDSFDVASIAALCADCMKQNISRDDDDDDDDDDDYDEEDLDDINDIMGRCGFSSTSYATTASAAASDITVQASAPTGINQLTTTITGYVKAPSPTETSSNDNNNSDDGNSGDGRGVDNSGTDDSSPTDNAAPAVVPFGGPGLGLLYLAGAFVAGAMVMLG